MLAEPTKQAGPDVESDSDFEPEQILARLRERYTREELQVIAEGQDRRVVDEVIHGALRHEHKLMLSRIPVLSDTVNDLAVQVDSLAAAAKRTEGVVQWLEKNAQVLQEQATAFTSSGDDALIIADALQGAMTALLKHANASVAQSEVATLERRHDLYATRGALHRAHGEKLATIVSSMASQADSLRSDIAGICLLGKTLSKDHTSLHELQNGVELSADGMRLMCAGNATSTVRRES